MISKHNHVIKITLVFYSTKISTTNRQRFTIIINYMQYFDLFFKSDKGFLVLF